MLYGTWRRLRRGEPPAEPSRPAQPAPSQPETKCVWFWDAEKGIRDGYWTNGPPPEPPDLRERPVRHSLFEELSRPRPEDLPHFWRNWRPDIW